MNSVSKVLVIPLATWPVHFFRLYSRVITSFALLLVLAACQSTPTRDLPQLKEEGSIVVGMQYSNRLFIELLEKYRTPAGELDYARWIQSTDDLALLAQQVQLIAQVSPDNHPEQFSDRAAERSYWISTYNTLVVHAVLRYWPLDSVRDVKLSFSSHIVPGKGFFYDQPVVVGGESTNLYDLEKKILRSQKDPRLHFALNCASGSCPVLQAWEWTEEELNQAAVDFINNEQNVLLAEDRLWLSRIFKWYRKDFGDDLIGYLTQYAAQNLAQGLAQAQAKKLPIHYFKYDWDLNDGIVNPTEAGH